MTASTVSGTSEPTENQISALSRLDPMEDRHPWVYRWQDPIHCWPQGPQQQPGRYRPVVLSRDY
jgi:hypothetical protein